MSSEAFASAFIASPRQPIKAVRNRSVWATIVSFCFTNEVLSQPPLAIFGRKDSEKSSFAFNLWPESLGTVELTDAFVDYSVPSQPEPSDQSAQEGERLAVALPVDVTEDAWCLLHGRGATGEGAGTRPPARNDETAVLVDITPLAA